jgi:hypothetical protein
MASNGTESSRDSAAEEAALTVGTAIVHPQVPLVTISAPVRTRE